MSERKSILKDKSFLFALRMVKLYQFLCENKREFVMSKQLLRSATSVGANIREAQNAESNMDFIHKLAIAQKERSEEHTSELQSRGHLVCRLLLEKKK